MSAVKIASRYAKSFLDLAKEQGKLEEVYNDFTTLSTTLKNSAELRRFIKSPVIKSDTKQKVFELIFGSVLSPITSGYIRLIISKGREPILEAITAEFISQYNVEKGISLVNIRSASELSQDAYAQIKEALLKATGSKGITIEQKVDPSLIGGFVIDMGDKVYDASVAHKLRTLKKQLIKS